MFSGLLVVALPVIIVGGNFDKEFTWFMESTRRKELRERAIKFGNVPLEQLDGISKSDRAFSDVYNFLLSVNAKCGRNIFGAKEAEILCAEGWSSKQRIMTLIRDPG